jgi:hypothetical protein
MSEAVERILGVFRAKCATKADVDALVRMNGHDYRTDRETLTTLNPDEKAAVKAGIRQIKERLP